MTSSEFQQATPCSSRSRPESAARRSPTRSSTAIGGGSCSSWGARRSRSGRRRYCRPARQIPPRPISPGPAGPPVVPARRPLRELQAQGRLDRREAELLRRDHQLQQFLRVRHEQERPAAQRRPPDDEPVEGEDRGALQQAGGLPPRGPDQAAPARGAHLPLALRRSVVDGDSLDRDPARRRSSSAPSPPRRPRSSSSRRCIVRRRCSGRTRRRSTGRTSRGCGWTKRCIRSRSSRSASTARR